MADKEVAVSVHDIHKEFILPQNKNTTFKQTVVNIVKKNNKVTQKTLDGVSFDVNKGDFFGIVGRNGSGKSTLLKLIAGVYTPTAGSVEVNGGLTPFIELGVGFNPELSGRDNVYLNGALLGFTRKEMATMYDEIVSFAELGPFMDQKLKNYSSGMQVRLAFSIAIKAKNDVLIFDEVLAVGDEAFQRKCLDVFEGYKASGQTVILVTHEMGTVKKFCNRAVLIHDGKVKKIGNPREVADMYSELNQDQINRDMEKKNNAKNSPITVKLVSPESEELKSNYTFGDSMRVCLEWDTLPEDTESVGVDIFKESGEHITGINSKDFIKKFTKSKATLQLSLDIIPGTYSVGVTVFNTEHQIAQAVYDGPQFAVKTNGKINWSGLVPLKSSWESK